jgi:hypothetical protein
MIKRAAAKREKTKTAFIPEAVDEKLGLVKTPEQIIRELGGRLSHEEVPELRESAEVFDKVKRCPG